MPRVYALFDDQTTEEISFKFLKPYASGERVEICFLSNVSANVRESFDKSIKEMYFLLTYYFNISPKISLWYKGFSKKNMGISTDLAFAVALVVQLIIRDEIIPVGNLAPNTIITATGVIGDNGCIQKINGIREKLIATWKLEYEDSPIIVLYPMDNQAEIDLLKKEDFELRAFFTSPKVQLIPIRELHDLLAVFNLTPQKGSYTFGKKLGLISLIQILAIIILAFLLVIVIGEKQRESALPNKPVSLQIKKPKMTTSAVAEAALEGKSVTSTPVPKLQIKKAKPLMSNYKEDKLKKIKKQSQIKKNELRACLQKANNFNGDGLYQNALKQYQNAAKLVSQMENREMGEDVHKLIFITENLILANQFFFNKEYTKAYNLYNEVVNQEITADYNKLFLYKQLKKVKQRLLIVKFINKGDIYLDQDEYQQAKKIYNEALVIAKENNFKEVINDLTTKLNLITHEIKMKNKAKIMELVDKVKHLEKMGKRLERERKYEEALQTYQEVKSIYKKLEIVQSVKIIVNKIKEIKQKIEKDQLRTSLKQSKGRSTIRK